MGRLNNSRTSNIVKGKKLSFVPDDNCLYAFVLNIWVDINCNVTDDYDELIEQTNRKCPTSIQII